jgi:hypothetical protein
MIRHTQIPVITRRETRDVCRTAVACLFKPWNKSIRRVAIVGNPGIGKSRGAMMFTLQLLLVERATVVLLAYKKERAYLFVLVPNGDWVVKSVLIDDPVVKSTLQIQDVVCLIDPPEEGNFIQRMDSYMILFSSLNSKKINNFDKDGDLIYMSMCSNEELCAMIPVLWNNASSDTSQPLLDSKNIELIQKEVKKRSLLVGGVPRYVFNYSTFSKRCVSIYNAMSTEVDKLTPLGVFQQIVAMQKALVGNSSGKFFFVLSLAVPGNTLNAYDKINNTRLNYRIAPNPLAIGVLSEQLTTSIKDSRKVITGSEFGAQFEWFVTLFLKHATLNLKTNKFQKGNTHEMIYLDYIPFFNQVKNLKLEDDKVLIPNSDNFPVLDFALSSNVFVNAKVSNCKDFTTSLL